MKDWKSQAHVKCECKFHIVILAKYRKKVIYGKLRRRIGEIIRELCRQKGVELEEGNALSDHIHMLLSVPSKYSIAMTIRYLKLKSAFGYLVGASGLQMTYEIANQLLRRAGLRQAKTRSSGLSIVKVDSLASSIVLYSSREDGRIDFEGLWESIAYSG